MRPVIRFVLTFVLAMLACSARGASQLHTASGVQVPQYGSVNMNSANTDHQITHIPWTRYIVRRAVINNCSGSLGATSTATLGIFTGAGGTGTTVVNTAVIVGLTGTTKTVDLALALTTDTLTASSLYVRVVTAQGSAATCDVSIIADPMA